MERAQKEQLVAELKQAFQENRSVLLISFKAVTVPDITELRHQISETGSGYRVVKNTLALRAAEDTPVARLKEHFVGPTAIAFTAGDPVALAKVLKTFIQTHPGMTFKAGVLGERLLSSEEIEELADLPSREVLLGKLLYLLNAPLARLAGALTAPLRNLASVLQQLEKVKP